MRLIRKIPNCKFVYNDKLENLLENLIKFNKFKTRVIDAIQIALKNDIKISIDYAVEPNIFEYIIKADINVVKISIPIQMKDGWHDDDDIEILIKHINDKINYLETEIKHNFDYIEAYTVETIPECISDLLPIKWIELNPYCTMPEHNNEELL